MGRCRRQLRGQSGFCCPLPLLNELTAHFGRERAERTARATRRGQRLIIAGRGRRIHRAPRASSIAESPFRGIRKRPAETRERQKFRRAAGFHDLPRTVLRLAQFLRSPATGCRKSAPLGGNSLEFRLDSCIKRVQIRFPPTAPAIVERRFVRFSGLSGANWSQYLLRRGRSGQSSNARQLFH